jgi:nicotinamide-nucleotide amidase
VGDNPARLESVVRQARGRSDLLVFSGGLGPTEDDLTKQTVARAFGDTLRFDEAELEKILKMLKDKGERKTFAYLRKLLKRGDYGIGGEKV